MVKIIIYIILILCLCGIVYKDIKEFIIPNIFNLIIAVLGIVLGVIENNLSERVITSSLIVFPFIIIYCYGYDIFQRECLGVGDIKLVISLGLILGRVDYFIIVLFFNLIFLLASIFLIIRYLFKREFPRVIALGPFIVLSFLIVLWGKEC